MDTKLLSLHGLKYNPFTPDVPIEALYVQPKLQNFCWRIKNTLIRDGGYALISGDPGTGKSVALRILMDQLSDVSDMQVGIITHPSSRLGDFYRELGDIYGVPLSLQNRWCNFKKLRQQWLEHIKNSLIKPIILIDESQETPAQVFNELRLLASQELDSQILLTVVLAGDNRLIDKLRREELVPLGSRIRIRINMEYLDAEQLRKSLDHLLFSAGNPKLMTEELKYTLCEHAMGNHRALCVMAGDLLDLAIQKEYKILDERLYHECFAPPQPRRAKKKN